MNKKMKIYFFSAMILIVGGGLLIMLLDEDVANAKPPNPSERVDVIITGIPNLIDDHILECGFIYDKIGNGLHAESFNHIDQLEFRYSYDVRAVDDDGVSILTEDEAVRFFSSLVEKIEGDFKKHDANVEVDKKNKLLVDFSVSNSNTKIVLSAVFKKNKNLKVVYRSNQKMNN